MSVCFSHVKVIVHSYLIQHDCVANFCFALGLRDFHFQQYGEWESSLKFNVVCLLDEFYVLALLDPSCLQLRQE